VAEWSLTHNGIYTISARAPVYVRAYHEGLIASSAATPQRRHAGRNTGTRVVLHPILYTVKLYRENLIDRLGETHRVCMLRASHSLYSEVYWQNLIDRLGDVHDVTNGL